MNKLSSPKGLKSSTPGVEGDVIDQLSRASLEPISLISPVKSTPKNRKPKGNEHVLTAEDNLNGHLNKGPGKRHGHKAAGWTAVNKSRVAAPEGSCHEHGGPGEASDGDPDDLGVE
ncbi:hypothetical protein PENANT_c020G07829 [Penicillium antarcticum]|uniref:Uncharacterized protein n=1 Tax=Penicillium antarcticum TaxID=416450 RepID=A0A1V6Q0U6_9EURO|nr:hypothetical protein PENANT_c020G07829 [Penicillium antarcticum]